MATLQNENATMGEGEKTARGKVEKKTVDRPRQVIKLEGGGGRQQEKRGPAVWGGGKREMDKKEKRGKGTVKKGDHQGEKKKEK